MRGSKRTVIFMITVLLVALALLTYYGLVHRQYTSLVVLDDSFISTSDGKAVLHVENRGREAVVLVGFELEGRPIEDMQLGDAMELHGNGVWMDRRTGEVGINVGGEGFIILELSGIGLVEGREYTLLIYTKDDGVLRVHLRAEDRPIP